MNTCSRRLPPAGLVLLLCGLILQGCAGAQPSRTPAAVERKPVGKSSVAMAMCSTISPPKLSMVSASPTASAGIPEPL